MRRTVVAILSTVLLAACAPESSDATTVAVTLGNDHVTLATAEISSGPTTFEIHNESDDLTHEVEVFAGATEGAVLPVGNSVADTAGLTLVDEVEDVLPGSNASLTVDLPPGTYLVVCNLPGHYAAGMWTYLTVTGG